MADENSKTTQNQSIHATVLQVLNTPSGETMTPQMLLGLVGLLDLAGILDYLQGNSHGLPLAMNAGPDPDKFRTDPQAGSAQDPAASNNAALLNTLMSLVGNKNGKINPSVLPLLINMLSTKSSDHPTPPKQESPPEETQD
ncbi:MAG: hypothetical protein AAGU23_11840 [Bacillota bacterium]